MDHILTIYRSSCFKNNTKKLTSPCIKLMDWSNVRQNKSSDRKLTQRSWTTSHWHAPIYTLLVKSISISWRVNSVCKMEHCPWNPVPCSPLPHSADWPRFCAAEAGWPVSSSVERLQSLKFGKCLPKQLQFKGVSQTSREKYILLYLGIL